MSEVEKMYEKVGLVSHFCTYPRFCDDNNCNECPNYSSEFTPEKQLELIKWLSTKELKIRTNKQPYAIYIGILGNDNTCFFGYEGLYFEQTLAEVINNLWQDLTEQERTEIAEILRG